VGPPGPAFSVRLEASQGRPACCLLALSRGRQQLQPAPAPLLLLLLAAAAAAPQQCILWPASTPRACMPLPSISRGGARLQAIPEMECDPLGTPPRGEVLIKGDPVFAGYHKNEVRALCLPAAGFRWPRPTPPHGHVGPALACPVCSRAAYVPAPVLPCPTYIDTELTQSGRATAKQLHCTPTCACACPALRGLPRLALPRPACRQRPVRCWTPRGGSARETWVS